MNLADEGLRLLAASRMAQQKEGHAHFWERALSRRQFLATTGLAGGAVATSSTWLPLVAEARTSAAPVPIPYATTIGNLFHFLPPASTTDHSSIFNFKVTTAV